MVETGLQEQVSDRDAMVFYAKQKDEAFVVEEAKVEYPESDGKPMGETGFHVRATLHLYGALRQFFRLRDDIYVAADMFLYYEEGNRYANKAPDVMVIKGVANQERRIFKTWEENAVPCVVFEITSKATMAEDLVTKSSLYAALGVQEYFIFDPLREYVGKAMMGFRLEHHEYVPLEPDQQGCLWSQELEVLLRSEDEILRIIDPHTGKAVPSLEEAIVWAEQEARRAEQETQRAKQEAQRAEQEAQRAEQEAQRAEQERQRSERLAAQLRALGIEPEGR
ncbi:hypothetical protein U27_05850 [Candidatus Vecturithrix granuli]|uniref:Putative restriction endonuclease domain-containing protein n=1 Tax=Vecturithrix granuli TaxID=1499967 RepID=A0A081C2S0_VECG1|nr:hypothetical protein U27_05850 [Candidatus Vecturithrix granuli]